MISKQIFGYHGDQCETNTDDCSPNPCVNGGTCADGVDDFTCSCPPGFSGRTCAEDDLSCAYHVCQNGGTCVDDAGGAYCTCRPGFAGSHCETDVDECASAPCLNSATCRDGENSFSCTCPPGFTGELCGEDVDECESSPCRNGGTCQDLQAGFLCVCPEGYSGDTCWHRDDPCDSAPCENNGYCSSLADGYQCTCQTGYTGVNCETDVDECAGVTCYHGSTCRDGIGWFQCDCADGFTGSLCDEAVDNCDVIVRDDVTNTTQLVPRADCGAHGTCSSVENGFVCLCEEGFIGDRCEQELGTPCVDGQVTRPHNSTWEADCNTCTCTDGQVWCAKMWCGPPECPYDETAGCPDDGECLSGCHDDKGCVLSPCLTDPCDKNVGHCGTSDNSATCRPDGEVYGSDCTRLGFYLETDDIEDGLTLETFCDVVRSLTLFDPFVVHHGMWIRCQLTGWDGPDAYVTLSLVNKSSSWQSCLPSLSFFFFSSKQKRTYVTMVFVLTFVFMQKGNVLFLLSFVFFKEKT
ncbi:uncharacterized protein LOC144922208 [Branchiostoma floridae x Branchiostoma belcheri]